MKATKLIREYLEFWGKAKMAPPLSLQASRYNSNQIVLTYELLYFKCMVYNSSWSHVYKIPVSMKYFMFLFFEHSKTYVMQF